MKVSERFGRFDDRSVIYAASERRPRIRRKPLWVTIGVGVILSLVLRVFFSWTGGLGAIVVLVLAVAFVVWYVIWRRGRNQRLTGSPTVWPTPDD